MKNKFLQFLIFMAAFLFASPFVLNAQNNQVFTLTADDLQNGKQITLDKLQWKYHAGDDANWANPNFDDSSWETLDGTILTLDNLPKSGWNGIGWFRLRLSVDEALINQQLALIMDHWGASEVYVDGKLINRFGTVGATLDTEKTFRPNKIPVLFDFHGDRREHLIAVRHSIMALHDDGSFRSWYARSNLQRLLGSNNGNNPSHAGVQMSLGKAENAGINREESKDFETGSRFWRLGLILMLGFLFLMLYIFYSERLVNLYFSLFAFGNAAVLISAYLRDLSHYDLLRAEIADFFTGSLVIGNVFLLLFLYTAFPKRIPKYFWFLVALTVGQLLASLIFSRNYIEAILYVSAVLFVIVESLRIVSKAIINKQNGALIVGVGIVMFSTTLFFNMAAIINYTFGAIIPLPAFFLPIIRQISTLGATIPIAIYLARQFAQTNKTLEAQLIKEVEHEREKTRFAIVEAENERRAKELEEARQLQLSMLPKKLPVIPNLEIAAYMKPATEVGGDYYDFHVGKDGTLTVAVGDATGHGLKAGTVVTATKSLFNNLADAPDIPDTLRQISRALKAMNLRGLFMALTLIKLKDNSLSVCAAGMPSTLVYRAADKTVEEISIRALPLGSMTNFNYRGQEFVLQTGDCVVVMSDGFPEMFNAENEMLGFDKAAEVLMKIGINSPQEIIDRFVEVSQKWAGERPADDDVTFVVLKIA